MDIWINCKKNMKILRQHYGLTQQEIANRMGISRGCYQHGEVKLPTGIFEKLITFWYENYKITPNEILLCELTKDDLEYIEQKRKAIKVKVRIKTKY